MNHCAGGDGPSRFDAVAALEQWIEQGKPPDTSSRRVPPIPARTRPLCPYPQMARYMEPAARTTPLISPAWRQVTNPRDRGTRSYDRASRVSVDEQGNLYLVELGKARVRKVNREGIVCTVLGSPPSPSTPQGETRASSPATTTGGGRAKIQRQPAREEITTA